MPQQDQTAANVEHSKKVFSVAFVTNNQLAEILSYFPLSSPAFFRGEATETRQSQAEQADLKGVFTNDLR